MSRPARDEWAMSLALVTARRATCLRRSVGCVLLNVFGHVMATGYNGVAAGQPHCNEVQGHVIHGMGIGVRGLLTTPRHPHACPGSDAPSGTQLDTCQAIHAEQNALLQCRDVHQIHTCYCTTSPCVTCVKLLLNTSCQRIVFVDEYPHKEAQALWRSAGRAWDLLEVPRASG